MNRKRELDSNLSYYKHTNTKLNIKPIELLRVANLNPSMFESKRRGDEGNLNILVLVFRKIWSSNLGPYLQFGVLFEISNPRTVIDRYNLFTVADNLTNTIGLVQEVAVGCAQLDKVVRLIEIGSEAGNAIGAVAARDYELSFLPSDFDALHRYIVMVWIGMLMCHLRLRFEVTCSFVAPPKVLLLNEGMRGEGMK
ncbi:hypothetical protein BC937DRAFT_90429 [Endogone sp. FLAS-F59071]|nr:hypothetical protein BC937DRAFT_90429 [Endogone sp. FLAS-F59071]|eukprot:RUS22098.1 hypothetical protein BC937DRAFT_90429 [Endogone sp. FLAS-F59071]